ncbi:hypothetical protein ELI30_08630 [Rhizobium leguminosarum]|uniref:hypothetical protein n=1 Tax=Rhizobium leguminosarum TaxID=384 RepID=UPI001031C9A8|nr:hypothetical protein [Rhizobium leguminosarum]TAV48362.1 hypothetical protein ELI32_09085 [Rhizobium leguminosarum]TAV57862.1 hypothetical protein ELI31_08615 [Rhizobium leguminosarum]TAV68802.1 hypothetical protein ELI30_08630 [Rhizobium leguminosarum]
MTQHSHAMSTESLISLPVLLLEKEESHLTFLHLGMKFTAAIEEVLDIQPCHVPIPNPQGVGTPQMLLLRETASVSRSEIIPARELMSTLPFVMARPSLTAAITRPFDLEDQRQEREWLISQGISPASEITMTTYTRTDSTQSTESRSGGIVDDQNSDSMKNDDANPSD